MDSKHRERGELKLFAFPRLYLLMILACEQKIRTEALDGTPLSYSGTTSWSWISNIKSASIDVDLFIYGCLVKTRARKSQGNSRTW
jgi:hypothetical protein